MTLRSSALTGTAGTGRDVESQSLARMFTDGMPEPEMLAGGMLYRTGVHMLSGAPDTGKTTLSLSWALEVIRAGHRVMFIDEEGGPRIVARRLADLGATPEECEAIDYFPFPGRSKTQWTPAEWRDLNEALKAGGPALVLIDSAAAVLAAAGLDENAAADVSVLWHAFTRMSRSKHGCAVVVIDHLAKNAEDSRYSRGSGAKLAASDVAYRLDMLKPFSRQDDGLVRVIVTKDREGYLLRAQRLRVLREPLRFEPEPADGEQPAEPARMPPAYAKVLEALDGEPRTIADLTDQVEKKHGHGLKRETVSRALSSLASLGFAYRLPGPGGRGHEAEWVRAGTNTERYEAAGEKADIHPPAPATDHGPGKCDCCDLPRDQSRVIAVTDPIGGHSKRSQITDSGLVTDTGSPEPVRGRLDNYAESPRPVTAAAPSFDELMQQFEREDPPASERSA